MSVTRFLGCALIACLTCLCGGGASAPLHAGLAAAQDPRPDIWPGLQPVPADSPPLAPADALKTFHLAPGYRIELVAAEPLVQDPVAIDWDPAGRLWVVEMPGYMRDIAAAGEHDPLGRIVVLEDTDRDGAMDRRTVFADGLVMARAVKPLEHGVLIGEPPHAWLMRDTDGDLRADTREAVTNQYGRREIDPQNNANAFFWSLDNWMRMAGQVDLELRLKDGTFQGRRTLRRGQWSVTQDDAGRIYRNTNESALHVDLVPTFYYARNPNLLRTRGSYERLADLDPELNVVWPIRPTPATNRAYQAGVLRPDGSLARFTAVCSPLVYRGDRLPRDLYGNVFVAEPAANLVSRLILEEDDRGLRARRAYARGEFLASTDERFRPVHLANAPDGTLYLVDMYRGVLEHRLSMTEYLRDQIVARRLVQPTGLGRIYRIVHETTMRDAARWEETPDAERLVETLAHPGGWWRDTAQRILVERGDRSVAPKLSALALDSPDWRTRLHALWTLDGLDAIEPAQTGRALSDPSPHVRASAVRLAERWIGGSAHPLAAEVLARLDDPAAQVRWQVAATAGVLPAESRIDASVRILDALGGDPVAVDAVLSGLRNQELAAIERLLARGEDETPARLSALAMLAATVVRGGEEESVQTLFARIAEASRPRWQRAALLQGCEIALLGGTMPGTPPRRAAAQAPCPTCPGGRLGPGGAYAYPRPEATRPPPGARGAGLSLTREPRGLAAIDDADLRSRAAEVLERIVWPGKPGVQAAPPLTSDERRRFDEGREIYRNLCAACHQPDGRGLDPIAPPVAGSRFALGAPEIAVRVLLHGKEGAYGLMPPVGGTLSDTRIAAVLTYIRREWGQTGTPVDAALVGAVRAATAGRTRPWTEAELAPADADGRRR